MAQTLVAKDLQQFKVIKAVVVAILSIGSEASNKFRIGKIQDQGIIKKKKVKLLEPILRVCKKDLFDPDVIPVLILRCYEKRTIRAGWKGTLYLGCEGNNSAVRDP